MSRLALLLLLPFASGCLDRKVGTMAQPAATFTPSLGPVVEVANVNEIVNDFIANPISAEQKWIGKRVRFSSVVALIDRDSRSFYVAVTGHIFVYPSPNELSKFGTLRQMDAVKIETTLVRFRTGDLAAGRFPQIEGEDGKLIAP